MVDLSISIVSRNRCQLLQKCLESILNERSALSKEIIVVDNASRDGTSAMVQKMFPQVKLIRNDRNQGFGKGHNQAFGVAQAKYFLLLNDDTEIPAGTFDRLADFMEQNPKAAVCSPELTNSDGSKQVSHFVRFPSILSSLWVNSLAYILMNRFLPNRDYPGRLSLPVRDRFKAFETAHVMGAVFFVRSSAYKELGMLDERFFIFREETDFCKRAKEARWLIYHLPQVKVMHLGGGPGDDQSYSRFRIDVGAESEWLYECKHRGKFSGLCLIIANLVVINLSCAGLGLSALFFHRHYERRSFLMRLFENQSILFRVYLEILCRHLAGEPLTCRDWAEVCK